MEKVVSGQRLVEPVCQLGQFWKKKKKTNKKKKKKHFSLTLLTSMCLKTLCLHHKQNCSVYSWLLYEWFHLKPCTNKKADPFVFLSSALHPNQQHPAAESSAGEDVWGHGWKRCEWFSFFCPLSSSNSKPVLFTSLSHVSTKKFQVILVPGTTFQGAKRFLQPTVVCVSTFSFVCRC